MITKYYLYSAKMVGQKFELEAIFKTKDAANKYAEEQKANFPKRPGMDYFYRIDSVLVEE